MHIPELDTTATAYTPNKTLDNNWWCAIIQEKEQI
jgi:hypothetical protein